MVRTLQWRKDQLTLGSCHVVHELYGLRPLISRVPSEVRYQQENVHPSSEYSIIQFDMASQDTFVENGTSVLEMSPDKERGRIEATDLVKWDGPENPMNWPKWKRLGHVALVSIIIFLVSV